MESRRSGRRQWKKRTRTNERRNDEMERNEMLTWLRLRRWDSFIWHFSTAFFSSLECQHFLLFFPSPVDLSEFWIFLTDLLTADDSTVMITMTVTRWCICKMTNSTHCRCRCTPKSMERLQNAQATIDTDMWPTSRSVHLNFKEFKV